MAVESEIEKNISTFINFNFWAGDTSEHQQEFGKNVTLFDAEAK